MTHKQQPVANANAGMLLSLLAPLKPFLDNPEINEICINRPTEIWTEGRDGWKKHLDESLTYENCYRLASATATNNQKAIDSSNPVFSGSLPHGERIQVLIPPASEKNTVSITIRKPSVLTKTLPELDAEGVFSQVKTVKTLREKGMSVGNHVELRESDLQLIDLLKSNQIAAFLDFAIKNHRNILLAGATGSGKTTISKSIALGIPNDERLITIEDVHELFLDSHPNRVHLFYSRDDEKGSKVSPKQALASCLRMKPDRILLAELRGDEAWEFIKSVNTGHPGSISTMHANGAQEAFEQLTALVKDSATGTHLDANYIKNRIYATIDIVIYCHRRKAVEIYFDPERKLSLTQ
jgi:type IV secretion system protein VirB11